MDDTNAKPEPKIVAAVGTASIRRARGRTQAEGAAILTGAALEAFARGVKFKPGRKAGARDALGRLIEQALTALPPNATWRDVLAKVVELDAGGMVIQEVERDESGEPEVIRWLTPDGREKSTTIATFRDRLTAARK